MSLHKDSTCVLGHSCILQDSLIGSSYNLRSFLSRFVNNELQFRNSSVSALIMVSWQPLTISAETFSSHAQALINTANAFNLMGGALCALLLVTLIIKRDELRRSLVSMCLIASFVVLGFGSCVLYVLSFLFECPPNYLTIPFLSGSSLAKTTGFTLPILHALSTWHCSMQALPRKINQVCCQPVD